MLACLVYATNLLVSIYVVVCSVAYCKLKLVCRTVLGVDIGRFSLVPNNQGRTGEYLHGSFPQKVCGTFYSYLIHDDSTPECKLPIQ